MEQPTEALTAFLRGLDGRDIGPAAAGPAGPAPTALCHYIFQKESMLM